MIIHLKKNIAKEKIAELGNRLEAVVVQNHERSLLVTSSKLKQIDAQYDAYVEQLFVFDTDIQLAHQTYLSQQREVKIGPLTIGGNSNNTLVITGPCSVESMQQIEQSAKLCQELGVSVLRAGSFKPRTSPYSFQGLGLKGLEMLRGIRHKYGLQIITEVRDATHVEHVIEYADIIQIGAKSM